ncbi:MAG TPA: AAA family ATPase [Candidatus Acidoferrales bacterium]|nr:AAA family ATPase [Candidatus Acidoferrales bacterium]
MRLETVRVTNFRCVDDSQEFRVADVTCLVGKNESGKTTILQALERLRSYDATKVKYDKLRDYPRKHLSEYADRHKNHEAEVVRTVWKLHAEDIAAVEELLGPGCLRGDTIKVSKAYEQETTTWSVGLDLPKVVSFLLEQCGVDADAREKLAALGSTQKIHADLTARAAELSVPQQSLKARVDRFRDHSAELAAMDLLSQRMPKFLYFSNYDRMSGDVSIDKLRQDIQQKKVSAEDQVFQDFLEFAGTTLDDLAGVTRFEDLRARVESASIRITRQIFEYWSQNKHLKVNFTIDAGRQGDPPPFNAGTVMRARIYNQLHDMTVPFSDRSAGFVWFFSFLVLFSQVKKHQGNVIILLDEPGLSLHAKAQSDLIRYFKEKLRPEHQVIYTTHSPFMVPPDDLASVRTVEDVVHMRGPFDYESLGTKVGDDVLSTDRDTLFPLQGALGYEITQSLFVGEHTLLVEGPSELLYFQAMSAALAARKRAALDRRWTVCPCNGIDKVQAFMSLFGGNKLHVAVLLDVASGQKSKVEMLKRSELLKAGHVMTVADFCGRKEADIEDMFDPDLFAAILNGTYELTGNNKMTGKRLLGADGVSERLVKKAEKTINAVLPAEAPEFSHFAPASWLIQHPETLRSDGDGITATLERFEKLFAALNGLLR